MGWPVTPCRKQQGQKKNNKQKTKTKTKNFVTSPLSITPEVAENIYIIQYAL